MQLTLVFLDNNLETSGVTLDSGEHVIGRDPACEVVVTGEAVSRRHARLTVAEAGIYLQDLGSANGTFVDGKRAEGRLSLRPGQRIVVGLVVIETRWTPTGTTAGESALPEELLAGRKYELGERVAAGGMGVVHRARDLHVRRAVAMKLMSDTAVITPAKRLRFLEEAQVTGQLEHPNIVPVYDLGIDDAGQPFYTMKFVRGITLKAVLDDILNLKSDAIAQFPLGRLLTIFQKACDAISFAHSKGVIHRDLKPDNIMIGDFGEVLVMDWGLAKTLTGKPAPVEIESSRAGDSAHRTRDGVVMGTPHFMSPEQANGLIDQLDVRTDIFMLGGVLYNILTLHPPFPGETAEEALQKIRAGMVDWPTTLTGPLPHCPGRRIPDSLAAVAMKALAMRPEDRYPTVRALQKDIEAYQGGFATSAEQAGTLKQIWLLLKRRKFEFTLATATVTALIIVGGVSVSRIVTSERLARESLQTLLAAAPVYASQAESLIEEHKFNEALAKIATAIELSPGKAEWHVLKGHILESLLRLMEARDAYAQALKLNPGNAVAKENLDLCEKLLRDNAGRTELLPASLNELQEAMLRQQRSAEALAMVRRLGQDTQALLETWRSVLEREGLLDKSQTPPRLIVDDAGTFYLNLNRTKADNIAALKGMPLHELHLAATEIRDLSPLNGAPLTTLTLAGTPVADLEPLRGLPLKVLVLAGCRNLTDLSPLCDCRQLETLILPPTPGNIDCLRQLPKLTRIAAPLRPSRPDSRGRTFVDEALPAAEFWKQYDAHR